MYVKRERNKTKLGLKYADVIKFLQTSAPKSM